MALAPPAPTVAAIGFNAQVSPRARTLAVCSVLVVALLAVAAIAPLPFTIAYPGLTANVLGSVNGQRVITVSGAETRAPSGELRMVTIEATAPNTSVHLADAVKAWFDTRETVLPRDAVYPAGRSTRQVEQQNAQQMRQSQDAATTAALGRLNLSPSRVKVTLKLADVGGPSAGLMFSLGIIDLINGTGRGGDLTAGRSIAGTGTITDDGTVGAVGGVALKEQAAKRDGASVFLVPRAECAAATAVLPSGLRLVPVTTLDGALNALDTLGKGGTPPTC
jgi:PDZ domain-containing protein